MPIEIVGALCSSVVCQSVLHDFQYFFELKQHWNILIGWFESKLRLISCRLFLSGKYQDFFYLSAIKECTLFVNDH